MSTVEIYDPAVDRWTHEADMPTPRGWLSTSVVTGRIYAIGGADQKITALPTVEAYDTGFSIDAGGKLPALWGEVRAKG